MNHRKVFEMIYHLKRKISALRYSADCVSYSIVSESQKWLAVRTLRMQADALTTVLMTYENTYPELYEKANSIHYPYGTDGMNYSDQYATGHWAIARGTAPYSLLVKTATIRNKLGKNLIHADELKNFVFAEAEEPSEFSEADTKSHSVIFTGYSIPSKILTIEDLAMFPVEDDEA